MLPPNKERTTMKKFSRGLLTAAAALAMALPGVAAARTAHVLVFSHSTGYRHGSIESGVAALKAMGARRGMTVVASEDPAIFDGDGLKGFDAIVLLSNSTKPDDPASEWWVGPRREAFQAFVHRGGGVVAIHAAADSHYNWPWYGRMIGGWFARHPKGTPAGEVTVRNARHPANRGLAPMQRRTDEWYYFQDQDPTDQVLVTLDPATIGEKDVNPNPAAWAHEFEGGRVFYTAMGHTNESFAEPWFLKHLEGGLNWVLRK
jgi:uncharacterized protein